MFQLRIKVLIVLACFSLACGAGLMGIGDEWTESDCATIDVVTFAKSFACPSEDAKVCHHSMLAAYHAGMALCLGLSDEDVEEELAKDVAAVTE